MTALYYGSLISFVQYLSLHSVMFYFSFCFSFLLRRLVSSLIPFSFSIFEHLTYK